jgi:hypothetical protein
MKKKTSKICNTKQAPEGQSSHLIQNELVECRKGGVLSFNPQTCQHYDTPSFAQAFSRDVSFQFTTAIKSGRTLQTTKLHINYPVRMLLKRSLFPPFKIGEESRLLKTRNMNVARLEEALQLPDTAAGGGENACKRNDCMHN